MRRSSKSEWLSEDITVSVVAGLVPGIHVLFLVLANKTWMSGTGSGMTTERL